MLLNKDLEYTLQNVFEWARRFSHEFVTVEHLLLLLLENSSAKNALCACGANLEKLSSNLSHYIKHNTPKLKSVGIAEIQPTLAFQRVLQRAVFHVQMISNSTAEVAGANVLVALFGEEDSQAVYLLTQQDIERLDIINYLSHGLAKTHEDILDYESSTEIEEEKEHEKPDLLDRFTENINKKALAGLIDPLIGRKAEIERAIQILCRRRKNNPLFIGESGVGKTALAEGLAYKITEGDIPDVLKRAVVYSLDLGGMIAGTKYRGDFEKRLKQMLKQLLNEPHAILFIDEIHTLIGAGSASGGTLDASNLLKPLLASSGLKCIGATTYQEYLSVFEKDKALARRFQKIDIEEPSVEETCEILIGLKPRFEKFHKVKYPLKSLKTAVELADKYLNDRALPDKAIDIIDEAGAYLKMKSSAGSNQLPGTVTVKNIELTVSKMARIPPRYLNVNDINHLKHLERDLKMVIFGQDEAIEKIVTAIKMSRSGLSESNRPIGSFLFAGATGVGKTETAKQLAQLSGIQLLRFDMSEYMERHTVSRLIGSPPGYVGYDQGGLLTGAVLKKPHAVVLLDEIEKAHPDIFNLLLQIMDYGTLTDANGRVVNFKNTLLIMTTNAGAFEREKAGLGFTISQNHSEDGMKEIKRLFMPEFRNRLDSIIHFNPLNESVILSIVNKSITRLQAHLEPRQVQLKVDKKAEKWLSSRGVSQTLGARPMQRLIDEHLKKKILDDLLFGELKKGGIAKFTVCDDKLFYTAKAHTQSSRSKKAKKLSSPLKSS